MLHALQVARVMPAKVATRFCLVYRDRHCLNPSWVCQRLEAFFQTVFDVGHPVETLECVAFTANRFCDLCQHRSGDAVLRRDAVALAGHFGGQWKPADNFKCLCNIHDTNLVFRLRVVNKKNKKNNAGQNRGCGLSGATYSWSCFQRDFSAKFTRLNEENKIKPRCPLQSSIVPIQRKITNFALFLSNIFWSQLYSCRWGHHSRFWPDLQHPCH